MPQHEIETHIREFLTEDRLQNALAFSAHLQENKMQLERGRGYWADKLYWCVKYQNQYVCFILIGGEEAAREDEWILWSDDSDSGCYKNAALDAATRDLAWAHVDFCGNCGGSCAPGTDKTLFGKAFQKVCHNSFRFDNPDAQALDCAKALLTLRKNDIHRNSQ